MTTPRVYESVIGRKRLLRTYERVDTSTFDDLLYCCAITVEDSMLQGGARPGVDYQLLDLFQLAMPLAVAMMNDATSITTSIPDDHAHAGLALQPPPLTGEVFQFVKSRGAHGTTGSAVSRVFSKAGRSKDALEALAGLVLDGSVLKVRHCNLYLYMVNEGGAA